MFCSLCTCKWKMLHRYFLQAHRFRQCGSQCCFNLRLMWKKMRELILPEADVEYSRLRAKKPTNQQSPPKTKEENPLGSPQCVAWMHQSFWLCSPSCAANWALLLTLLSAWDWYTAQKEPLLQGAGILSCYSSVSLWEEKISSHPVSPNYKVKIIPFYSLLNRTAPGKQKQTLVIALCPWSP